MIEMGAVGEAREGRETRKRIVRKWRKGVCVGGGEVETKGRVGRGAKAVWGLICSTFDQCT